jgi:hypothetical protein
LLVRNTDFNLRRKKLCMRASYSFAANRNRAASSAEVPVIASVLNLFGAADISLKSSRNDTV